MDQKKVGIFISKLRKEKNLTQSELAEKIGISGKSISKWECGVAMPDLGNLSVLSTTLGVTVDELLCGERKCNLEEKNELTINSIAFYMKYQKNVIIKISVLIIFIAIFLFLIFLYINNYYKWSVSYLDSSNESYFVSGYLISNQEKDIFVIDNVAYLSNDLGTAQEPKIFELSISLYYENKELINSKRIYDNYLLLHNCFENFSLVYEGNIEKDIDKKKLSIQIAYVDSENEKHKHFIEMN